MESKITIYKKNSTPKGTFKHISSVIHESIGNMSRGFMDGGICKSQIDKNNYPTSIIESMASTLFVVTADKSMRSRNTARTCKGVQKYGDVSEEDAITRAKECGLTLKPNAIWGFAICKDVMDTSRPEPHRYLYIELICASSEDKSGVGKGRVSGRFLMNEIQKFIANENSLINQSESPEMKLYSGIKLSALPSVILYYRMFGFKFTMNKGDVEDPEIQKMIDAFTKKHGKNPFVPTKDEIEQGIGQEQKVETILKQEYHDYIQEKEHTESSYENLPDETFLKLLVQLVLGGFSVQCNTPELKERVKKEGFFISVYEDEGEDEYYNQSEEEQKGGDKQTPPVSETILFGEDYTPPSPLPLESTKEDKDTSLDFKEAEETMAKWQEEEDMAKEVTLDYSCTEEGFAMTLDIDKITKDDSRDDRVARGVSASIPLEKSLKQKKRTAKRSLSGDKTRKRTKPMTNKEVKNMRRACGKKCFYDNELIIPVCKPKTCKTDKRRLKRAFKNDKKDKPKTKRTRKLRKVGRKIIINQSQSQSQTQEEKPQGVLDTITKLFTVGKRSPPSQQESTRETQVSQETPQNRRKQATSKLNELTTAYNINN